MPESITPQDISSQTDPSVSKQWDDQTPKEQQFKDFAKIADGIKFCLLTTMRPGIGPVSRSMAVARRDGPDFLFLANIHSRKFGDLKSTPTVHIGFQDNSTKDWISVTGKATTATHDDPRIKEVFTTPVSAWFGDLGDGVHNGTADDPRMALIEVRSNYVSYYKHEVGALGYMKEVAGAAMTGKVAQTGILRQLEEQDLEQARKWEK